MTDASELETDRAGRRLSMRSIFGELLAVLSWEKGAPYTTTQLLIWPGKTVHRYLSGEVGRLTNPVRYLLMSVALVTLAFIYFMPASAFTPPIDAGQNDANPVVAGFDETDSDEIESKSQDVVRLLEEIQSETVSSRTRRNSAEAIDILQRTALDEVGEISLTWMNVFLLFALPINSLISWIAFRKAKLNLAEHLATNAYILGIGNFAAIAFLVPGALFDFQTAMAIYMLLSVAYQFFAWTMVFKLRKVHELLLCLCMVGLSAVAYVVLQTIGLALVYVVTLLA